MPTREGVFHLPLWCEAREQEAVAALALAAGGRRASEVIGTRAQVLAALYLQERWRRRRKEAHGAAVSTEGIAASDEDEIIEVSIVLSLEDLEAAPVASPPRAVQPPPPPTTAHPDSEHGAVEKEMTVARPLDDVFAVISGFEEYPRWVTGLHRVEVLERDAASGLGTAVRFTVGAMGLSLTYTLAFTASRSNGGDAGNDRCERRLNWTSIAGGVKSIVGQYHLIDATEEVAAPRTRVRYKLDVDTGFKMPALLRRTATSLVVGAALPDLKKYLEADHGRKSWSLF